MAIDERRERERAARRRLIVTTARTLAETEGWDAVTTRRLSTEIEYSQPVLYKHFSGMDRVAEAVAIDGFAELAEALRAARTAADTPGDVPLALGRAYLDFARDNPAVYDAMFTRATALSFATEDTPPPLIEAFAEFRQGVTVGADERNADARSEVFWAGLHGLATLTRAGRLRAGHEADRLRLLVDGLTR
jgi:AcrR family transcriptional regulator